MSLKKLYSDDDRMTRRDWWSAWHQVAQLFIGSVMVGAFLHWLTGHYLPDLGRVGAIVAIVSLFMSAAVLVAWPATDLWEQVRRKLGWYDDTGLDDID